MPEGNKHVIIIYIWLAALSVWLAFVVNKNNSESYNIQKIVGDNTKSLQNLTNSVVDMSTTNLFKSEDLNSMLDRQKQMKQDCQKIPVSEVISKDQCENNIVEGEDRIKNYRDEMNNLKAWRAANNKAIPIKPTDDPNLNASVGKPEL